MQQKLSGACLISLLALAACVPPAATPASDPQADRENREKDQKLELQAILAHGQDTYGYHEIGHIIPVEYGTVLRVRDIAVMQPQPANGGPIGTQAGVEYTIVTRSGKLFVVPESKADGDTVFAKGDHVLLQVGGGFQRVLPASHLPGKVLRPGGVEFEDSK